MIVLGIDPGTATMGYGLIEKKKGDISCLEYGVIKTPKDLSDHERLLIIDQRLEEIFEEFNPVVMAIEKVYFKKNVKTAMTVTQAKGVAMLKAAKREIPLHEFTPSQIKSAITGHGKADKAQVQMMIKAELNLKEKPRPDDAADALGAALCGLQKEKLIS